MFCCPTCDSDKIKDEDVVNQDRVVGVYLTCRNCGFEWELGEDE